MTDKSQQEPVMEDVLASIKKILSEDQDGTETAAEKKTAKAAKNRHKSK